MRRRALALALLVAALPLLAANHPAAVHALRWDSAPAVAPLSPNSNVAGVATLAQRDAGSGRGPGGQSHEAAYAAWVADHAARLLDTMELRQGFTLGDLRDAAAALGVLVDEARVVLPPTRYASAHAAYLSGMDYVERVRAGLQTVVGSREPLPELQDALFEAGQGVARGLLELRQAGIALPPWILGTLGVGEEVSAVPAATVDPAAADAREVLAATPAAGSSRRPSAHAMGDNREACAGTIACAISGRVRVGVLAVGPLAGPARPPMPAGEEMLAVRARLENLGPDSYVVRPYAIAADTSEGRMRPLTHPIGGGELVPRAGLLLAPGEGREGLLYFAVPRGVQLDALRLGDAAAPDSSLAIALR